MNINEVEKKNKNNSNKIIFILLIIGIVLLSIYVDKEKNKDIENVNWNSTFKFSKNKLELPESFDSKKLKSAIVTNLGDSEMEISYIDKYANKEQISNVILDLNTVAFEIDMKSLEENKFYEFSKSKMKFANWKDVNEGDLLYFYEDDFLDQEENQKTKVVIFVHQEPIFSDEILDVIQSRNLSGFENESFEMLDYEGYCVFLNDKFDSLDTQNQLDFESIVKSYDNMKIKYLPIASDLNRIELVCNYNDMNGLEKVKVIYDSFNKVNDGYEIMISYFDDKDDSIISLKIAKNLVERTRLMLESNVYQKGDELIVYINNRGKIELIKDFIEKTKDQTFVGEVVYDKNNEIDSKQLIVVDKFGNEKEVYIDESFTLEDLEISLDGLIGEFSLDVDDYVLDVTPILSTKSPRNVYRLLNILDGKVELGYKNKGNVNNSDFAMNERIWVDLAEELIVFPDKTLDNLIGKSIGIRLNSENEIDFIADFHSWAPKTYDFKSPVDVDGESKSSLTFEVLDFNKSTEVSLMKINEFDIDESTNYYIYNYDFEYDFSHKENFKNLLNQNFDKVENLKKKETKEIYQTKYSSKLYKVYLVCYDYELNDSKHVRDIIEVSPKLNSVFDINLLKDKISVKKHGNINVGKHTKFIEINGNYNYLNDEYLQFTKRNINGWVLLDQNQQAKYIFSLEVNPILFQEKLEFIQKKLVEKYGLGKTFATTINDIVSVTSFDKFVDVNTKYPYGSKFKLQKNQKAEQLFADWLMGDEFMVYRFTTSNPFGLDSKEDTYLGSVVPIKSMNSDIIYRYLGKLDGDMIFGYGGNIGDNDFDSLYSFSLDESDIPYIENLNSLEKLSDNEIQIEPEYVAAYANEQGAIEFIKKIDFISELSDAQMSSKILKGKSLEGKYIDADIEIMSVNKNPEFKLTIKTSNGKEYEVGSKSDNWKLYEKGQKLKVRFEIKDGVPINICWAKGLRK